LDAAGYYHRGQAFLLNWEDLAARKDFRHASRLDPTLTRAELLSAVAELRSPPGERLSGAKKEGAHGKGLGLPRDPYGQFCRGQSYFMSGDYEKAEAELSGAIARGVKTPNAYLYRAQANCYMGNFDQAFDVLTNAGTADPERVTSLRAWVHVRRGCARWANPAEALSDFDEALRLFPTYSDAYYYRGRTRLNQGDASGAMADLSSAIAGNTKEPDCYFQRGILFLTDGNCAPAVLDFEQAIRLNPSHGPLIYNYIRSRLEPGATASDLRDVFTRFGPDADHFSSIDLPMLLSRGLVRAAENDVGRAVEDFNRSLELDPKSAIALTARAEVLLSTGEYGQTIDDCQRALQIGSLPAETERKARQTLAKAYTHSKDYDRAIAEYDKAIARCPDPSGNLTSNRALALQAKGDYANAIEAWTAILGRLPWTGFLALHQRGIAWLQLGNNDQALQDFNQYIDRFSGDNALQNAGVLLLAQAYAHRGRLWRKKGDYGRATCDLDEALRLGTVNGHSELLMELALAERAWVWAACPDAAFRDGSRAVEAATRICEATAWACVDDIEALAAGYAEMGKFDEAVRRQRQALGCPTFQHYKPDDAEAALERLRLYESGHAFRGVCSRLS
jgi:tetratricopeptide (TPR) repeat protein